MALLAGGKSIAARLGKGVNLALSEVMIVSRFNQSLTIFVTLLDHAFRADNINLIRRRERARVWRAIGYAIGPGGFGRCRLHRYFQIRRLGGRRRRLAHRCQQ